MVTLGRGRDYSGKAGASLMLQSTGDGPNRNDNLAEFLLGVYGEKVFNALAQNSGSRSGLQPVPESVSVIGHHRFRRCYPQESCSVETHMSQILGLSVETR